MTTYFKNFLFNYSIIRNSTPNNKGKILHIINFVVSVFPALLSPLAKIDWLRPSFIIALNHDQQKLTNLKHEMANNKYDNRN
jgi:hypothetical protein